MIMKLRWILGVLLLFKCCSSFAFVMKERAERGSTTRIYRATSLRGGAAANDAAFAANSGLQGISSRVSESFKSAISSNRLQQTGGLAALQRMLQRKVMRQMTHAHSRAA